MRLLLLLAVGCRPLGEGSPRPPGGTPGLDPELVLEAAPPGGDYGDLRDGASLWCGIPPQGGAPFSPIRLRLYGDEAILAAGTAVEAVAADLDSGEPLVYTALTLQLLLSNVGDSDGAWVGPEVHLRYDGWPLEALEGRTALLVLRVTSLSDPRLVGELEASVELSL